MKPKQGLFLLMFLFLIIQTTQNSSAQDSKYTYIFNPDPAKAVAIPMPVGSGARALGQGGAFIAIADDATAASWNPGGLVQLEKPELSLVGSFLTTQQTIDSVNSVDTRFSFDNETVYSGDLNYASVAYPFQFLGHNMVAALNYQQIYDFGAEIEYYYVSKSEKIGYKDVNIEGRFESRGGIGALTPAVSMRITPKIFIGVSVNFYMDEYFGDYAWRETTKSKGHFTALYEKYTIEEYSFTKTYKNFHAINVTTGLLWNAWEENEKRLTFGAVYDTPYTADVDMDRVSKVRIKDDQSGEGTIDTRKHHYEIDYPMSFGVGMNFRSSDALSFSMDVTWADWSEYMRKNEKGNKTRPLGHQTPDDRDRDIDDTYSVRLGTEYLIFGQKAIIPIRGGIFYDPRPSLDNPADVYGFSLGSGITFERFSFDVAYQFRWANDVDGEDFGLDGTNFNLTEHMVFSSIIVYF